MTGAKFKLYKYCDVIQQMSCIEMMIFFLYNVLVILSLVIEQCMKQNTMSLWG